MEQLEAIIDHLKKIRKGWFGEITIKVKDGRVVLITEERTFKLDDGQEENGKNSKVVS